MPAIEEQVTINSAFLMEAIAKNADLVLLSKQHSRLKSGIVVFKHLRHSNEALYKHLQDNGVICAMRGGGIRFSPHFYNSHAEMEQALEITSNL